MVTDKQPIGYRINKLANHNKKPISSRASTNPMNVTPIYPDNEPDKDLLNFIESIATEELRSVSCFLIEYIQNMWPGKAISESDIHKNQLKLKNVINSVLDLEQQKFVDGMNFLVSVVREYRKTVFNERYIYRGFNTLKLSNKEKKKFELMLSLLNNHADVKNILDVRNTTDFNILFKYIEDNKVKQKLISYYNV